MRTPGSIVILAGALADVLAPFALGACVSQKTVERLTTRVENLENIENRAARPDDVEQRLARIEAQSAHIAQLVEALTARLDGLDSRLAALAEQQARAAAPSRSRISAR